MLTEEQQRFIFRYINNKGDFYKTVDSLGLDLSHVMTWQKVSQEFDREFAQSKQQVIQHLKQENYVIGLLRVNEALMNGVTQQTVQQRHRIGVIDEEGNDTTAYEVTRTTKNLGTPAWAINEALKESSLERAIQTLASEGLIPTAVARKLLQSANRITTDIKASFDIAPNEEFVNDKKVMALIKSAVLGAIE